MKRKIVAAFAAILPVRLAGAVPYQPAQDAQILEQVAPSSGPASQDLRALRKLADAPGRTGLALTLAERYVARGKAEADPRYYGYAEGLLKNWRAMPKPPPKVLLLGALIKQHRHDFDGALQDLDELLKRQPDNAQGWLTRAVILLVEARYPEALQSCAPLIEVGDTLLAATCLAQVNSLLGQAQKSYAFLLDVFTEHPEAGAEQRQWTLTVLADIAARLGKTLDADNYFSKAVGIDLPNVYLFGAYADFLLDQHQPQKVLSLLQDKSRIDALFLRTALAKQQLADRDLAQVAQALEARFAASRMRGENLHQGDEARFTLHVLNKPDAALQLAKANWQAQREPKDARILLEAALAAQDADAAKPVLDQLRATKMEHPQLQQLAAQIRQMQ